MIAYDLHIHSCLSPAADDEMTPAALIDRAVANGLDLIALTDTNSARNIEAAMEYAEDRIALVPGVEVEAAEEVKVVCLFPDLQGINRMQRIVSMNLTDKPNKPNKFGNQILVDEFGDVIGTEDRLLQFPTKMNIEEVFYAARQMGGAAFYAHLENKASSVLSVLGMIPASPAPKAVECTNNAAGQAFYEKKARALEKITFFNSDAYRLADINTADNAQDLEALGADIRRADGTVSPRKFIDWLRAQPGI